jgi:hypothetical protein
LPVAAHELGRREATQQVKGLVDVHGWRAYGNRGGRFCDATIRRWKFPLNAWWRSPGC